jgi:hypothetical protein
MSLIAIREAGQSDIPFIRDTWYRSTKDCCALGGDRVNAKWKGPRPPVMQPSVFRVEHHRTMTDILSRDGVLILVAGDHDDTSQLYGHLVAEGGEDRATLHFVFVKQAFRRLSIATQMFEVANGLVGGGPYWASHWTHLMPRLLKHHSEINIEYNPYRSFRHGFSPRQVRTA